MTIAQILKFSADKLIARGIDTPFLEAEILLSHVLKKPQEFLFTHGEKKLSSLQISSFKFQISKRLKDVPAAYLTSHKEFYGLDFKVNQNILIPRPETELMVDEALKLVAHGSQSATILDVGTGSGCIIITLAKQIKNYELPITNYKFIATDISAKALALAKQNAKAHHVNKKIKFIKGNLLEPITKNNKFVIRNSKFVITANLPYLTPTQIKNSSSIKYESKSALDGGLDGLRYYKRLFKQIKQLRVAGCGLRDITILCEIDPRQTAKIKLFAKQLLPKAKLQIKKDLSGLNRLAIVKII